ncbi:DNA-binding protein HU [compost metagenome]
MSYTKANLISEVAEATGLSNRDATAAVNATLDAIVDLGMHEPLTLKGFGRFEPRVRSARTIKSKLLPGGEMSVQASKVLAFKAAPGLKRAV